MPGYWGNEIVKMKNLEELQAKGVTFLNFHATPFCASSRYSLLSGNYAHRGRQPGGSWRLNEKGNQFIGKQRSITKILRKKGGYHTSMFGKWHIGAKVPVGGTFNKNNTLTCCNIDWNKPMLQGPNDIGFDESYYTMGGIQSPPYSWFRNGYLITENEDITYWRRGVYNTSNGVNIIPKPGEGDVNWESSEYNKRLVIEAENFLKDHSETRSDDPFFMLVSLGQVHGPHSPPNFYLDGTPIAGQYDNPHLDLLYEMDLVVGTLISAITDRGLMDNTLVIFASDNGGLNMGYPNRVLRGKKNTIWEGGTRIPFIMRFDGVIPAKENRTDFIGINDVYSTLAEFAGISYPKKSAQDSVSFAKYAISTKNLFEREYLGTWNHIRSGLVAEAILYSDFKYIRFHSPQKYDALYNITNDIGETKNLLELEPGTYDAVKVQLKSKLRELGFCPLDRDGNNIPITRFGKRDRLVKCSWFSTKKRCKKQLSGELYCNSRCGRHRLYCGLYQDDFITAGDVTHADGGFETCYNIFKS